MVSNTFLIFDFNLTSTSEFKFLRFTGFAIQNFLFKLLGFIDKELAIKLHNSIRIKPYSVTPLLNNYRTVYHSGKGNASYNFRIVFFDEEYFDIFHRFYRLISEKLYLDNIVFLVNSIHIKVETYDNLLKYMVNDYFTLDFITPTCFKTGIVYPKRVKGYGEESIYEVRRKEESAYCPLPIPELMLRNLLRIWKSFSSKPLPSKNIEDIISEDHIFVYDFPKGIRTMWAREGSRKNQQGFIGKVTFGTRKLNNEAKNSIAALIKLGEYSGTGIMRTAGLGYYKIIEGINKKKISSTSETS